MTSGSQHNRDKAIPDFQAHFADRAAHTFSLEYTHTGPDICRRPDAGLESSG